MLDEGMAEKLSAYADGELDAQAAGEVERALAQDPALRACLEQFRRLDGAAGALPLPRMSEAASAEVWNAVRLRTLAGAEADLTPANLRRIEAALDEPPNISDDRWRRVWNQVREQTTDARLKPIDADLTPGPMQGVERPIPDRVRRSAAPIPLWRSLTALAAAAAILVVSLLTFVQHEPTGSMHEPSETKVAAAAPKALDQRYFVMVQHVPGIEQPVVCFFLKEPDPDLEEIESWQ